MVAMARQHKKYDVCVLYLELELFALDNLRLLAVKCKIVRKSNLLARLVEGSLGRRCLCSDDRDGRDDAKQEE
jgi:hypothetical protein